MIENTRINRATSQVTVNFTPPQGERWRKFLERLGTRSNDFATRLSRARFVYLHRRESDSQWLPL